MWQLLRDLRAYQRAWLPGDIAAAVTVWAIVVPESVAYAGIAGVPPEIGLYVATVPLIVYALIGSSRRMTVGPSATGAKFSTPTTSCSSRRRFTCAARATATRRPATTTNASPRR